MSKSIVVEASVFLIGLVLVLGSSYWFATICEPQALWLWRDILHVLPFETCR